MNVLPFRYLTLLPIIWFSVSTSSVCRGQTNETTDAGSVESEYQNLEEVKFYASFGPNYNQFSGKGYPVKFGYKSFIEGGVLIEVALFTNYPFYTGVEYQRKGYDIDQFKTGYTQGNKYFESKIKGRVRIDYISIPMLFKFPKAKINNRLHLLTGPGVALRFQYFEKFEGTYSLPADTVVIPISYQKTGNDALDFLDFNFTVGGRYYLGHGFEVWALASRKIFGLSLGKQNFITTLEINTNFTVKLVYKLPDFFGMNH